MHFFKSLLFLGAGVVIHFIHSNEMKDMGGLENICRLLILVFLLHVWQFQGIPPLAGFFSKEEILLAASHSNKIVFWIALLTSGLTAFYMFRLYFSIFWNKKTELHQHHGEAPVSMKLPLIILTVLFNFCRPDPFWRICFIGWKKLLSHILIPGFQLLLLLLVCLDF
jgi:NADH-quinone oxidoreductase subunit L